MSTLTITVISWLICGFVSTVLIILDGKDFETRDIVTSLCASVGGPVMLVIYFFTKTPDRVLIKRRRSTP